MTQHGVPAFSASVVPPDGQSGSGKDGQGQQGNVGRATPQPSLGAEEMTEEEVTQLLKDHKELRMSNQNSRQNVFANTHVQARNIPKSRSTTSKRRIRSNNCKTAWHIKDYHSQGHHWTTASTLLVSIDWTVSLHN